MEQRQEPKIIIGKVEYKSHTYEKNNDTSESTVEINGSGWKTLYYTNYKDWKDDAASSYGNHSVKKYGGFYIARYEAGWNGKPDVKTDAGTNYVDSYSAAKKYLNVTDYTPVSKKGVFSWNFISQTNAKTVSESMYKNGEEDVKEGNVQSKLVDGTAWDTVTNWIEQENSGVATSSSNYGNYRDTDLRYTGLYAKHIWAERIAPDTSDHWLYAKKISNGTITLKQEQIQNPYETDKASDYADTGINSPESHTFWTRYELPTGSLENFKLNNIYDLAGNVWEWTTEVGNHKETDEAVTNGDSFAVLRGGSFRNNAPDDPLCFRYGDHSSSNYMDVSVGFRVVLYIK